MTDIETIERIVADFESIDTVWEVHGHEWDTTVGFKIEVILEPDTQSNAELMAVLREHDLRIWWVGFDTRTLALVPADGFQWDYSEDENES